MFSKTAIIAASLLTVVSAHQNFHQFWVNDVTLGYQKAIRMPPSNSPVTDVTSNDITCNVNGNKVPSGVATQAANAGDTIKVQWDNSGHPGPITHFLFGPVTDASQATGIGSWTKIDEFDSENGTWANAIMQKQDMTYSFKLPTGLASGDYLLRSEMLALHGAQTIGGGQFYIGCAQLKITGTAGGSCSSSIKLPGAYKETDDSIYIPNVYNGFDITSYKAPGGPVASCGSGSGSGSGSTPTTSAAAVESSTVAEIPSSIKTSVVATPTTTKDAVSAAPTKSSIAVSAVPTTLQTLVATTPSAVVASATARASAPAATVPSDSNDNLPTSTTLDSVLSWISRFRTKTAGTSYDGTTVA